MKLPTLPIVPCSWCFADTSENDIKDNMLFWSALETNTRAVDDMKKSSTFFDHEGLHWENVCGICTEGAPAM